MQYTYYLFFILVLSLVQPTLGQTTIEHRFSLKLENETIFVGIVIKAGSICQGIAIERSTDSLQFEEVWRIVGTCGSSFTDVPYTFTDLNPVPNAPNYYRLKFGDSGYSAVEKVLFVRLIGGVKVVPNPVGEQTHIFFNNPNNKVAKFNLYDVKGNLVMTMSDIKQDNFIVQTQELSAGVYSFAISGEGIARTSGKFVKL